MEQKQQQPLTSLNTEGPALQEVLRKVRLRTYQLLSLLTFHLAVVIFSQKKKKRGEERKIICCDFRLSFISPHMTLNYPGRPRTATVYPLDPARGMQSRKLSRWSV